jgi:hypothetical protein
MAKVNRWIGITALRVIYMPRYLPTYLGRWLIGKSEIGLPLSALRVVNLASHWRVTMPLRAAHQMQITRGVLPRRYRCHLRLYANTTRSF